MASFKAVVGKLGDKIAKPMAPAAGAKASGLAGRVASIKSSRATTPPAATKRTAKPFGRSASKY